MQLRGLNNMETSTALFLLVHLSLHTVDEGHAINPSCSCIRFTSTHGKDRGTFSSPDYPRPYPQDICLLYTFYAEPHQIVELVFTDFDIYKELLDIEASAALDSATQHAVSPKFGGNWAAK